MRVALANGNLQWRGTRGTLGRNRGQLGRVHPERCRHPIVLIGHSLSGARREGGSGRGGGGGILIAIASYYCQQDRIIAGRHSLPSFYIN